MECSNTKMDIIKQVLAKAGIPMALTLAGYMLVRMSNRKSCSTGTSLPLCRSQENSQEADSSAVSRDEDSSILTCPTLVMKQSCDLQEEILGLRSQVEDIRAREGQIEKWFLCYQDMKDKETVLMELQNKLLFGVARIESLGRGIMFLEAENQGFEKMVLECLKILEILELSRSENREVGKIVKKLCRKTRRHSFILRKQRCQIQAKEAEISRNRKEIELKTESIRKMEGEIMELKLVNEQLKWEKNDLSNKLTIAEESIKQQVDKEMVAEENYNKLASELERVKEIRAAEVKELIYLRWINASLRHERMMRNQENEEPGEEIDESVSDNELNNKCIVEEGDSYLGFTTGDQDHVQVRSRRRKLFAKFKRWVEGMEKEKTGNKFFHRHSDCEEGRLEVYRPARKSSSSA